MRRFTRALGALLIGAGLVTLAWAFVVWRWEDPFTGLYTQYEQRNLANALDDRFDLYRGRPQLVDGRAIAAEALRYRRRADTGDAIGRLDVPRLDLRMVLVYGTDSESLKRGPGLDGRTWFPGQGRLIYIAGHRTTYAAPFSEIDRLRRGDVVTLEMPYGTFVYRVTGHRIVRATELSVLRSRGREEVALQACHPRFFASHRWVAYGRLVERRPAVAEREASNDWDYD